MAWQLHQGDCIEVLRTLASESVDACVTDPPYGLEFMGKEWDSFKTYNGGNPNLKPQGSKIKKPGDGYGYRQKNFRCRNCGKLKRGNGCCKCPEPRWDTRTSESAYQFQCFCEDWAREVLRVLKPGGHLLAFSGTRTYHRMVCAIEDAGFEIRDQIGWLYGSGFPKSLDVSKAIDKRAGAVRKKQLVPTKRGNLPEMAGEISLGANGFTDVSLPITQAATAWQGWGTALKPAWEPIVLARKPLIGTVAENVLKHGTGGINVDGCRVGGYSRPPRMIDDRGNGETWGEKETGLRKKYLNLGANGRWPANVIHDGSPEVLAEFRSQLVVERTAAPLVEGKIQSDSNLSTLNSQLPTRFFYCAKASKKDRDEGCDGALPEKKCQHEIGQPASVDGRADLMRRNHHPTVKPTALMRYLCKLVTPPGGVVLDPFTGSGSTGKAALLEGFSFIGIERDPEYLAIARARIKAGGKRRTPNAAREEKRPPARVSRCFSVGMFAQRHA